MIAILDVHYQGQKAQAACVTASDWSSPAALHHYLAHIEAIQDYEPGAFYKRELPCLLSVLQTLPALPQAIVIDGYVWLCDEKRAGLGPIVGNPAWPAPQDPARSRSERYDARYPPVQTSAHPFFLR
jgi:deoxyinosine 3'endonuclease (endonuclease V)